MVANLNSADKANYLYELKGARKMLCHFVHGSKIPPLKFATTERRQTCELCYLKDLID